MATRLVPTQYVAYYFALPVYHPSSLCSRQLVGTNLVLNFLVLLLSVGPKRLEVAGPSYCGLEDAAHFVFKEKLTCGTWSSGMPKPIVNTLNCLAIIIGDVCTGLNCILLTPQYCTRPRTLL